MQVFQTASPEATVDEQATLLLLGDECTGKSALLGRFPDRQHTMHALKYVSDYSYMNVPAEDDTTETVGRLSIWQINNETHLGIVQSAVFEPQRESQRLMAAVVLDLSRPWAVFASLDKWLAALGKLSEATVGQLPQSRQRELRDRVSRHVQSYVDPSQPPTALKATSTERAELTIDADVPARNLGFPVVIICSKADQFAQNFGVDEAADRFDSFVYYLREKCLPYAAALSFTCIGGEAQSVGLLRRYVLHRMFNFRFASAACVVVSPSQPFDKVFVPSGFDSSELLEQSSGHRAHRSHQFKDSTDAIATLFPEPRRQVARKYKTVECSKDQNFLAELAHLPTARQRSHTPQRPSVSGKSGSTTPRRSDTNVKTFFEKLLRNDGKGKGGGKGKKSKRKDKGKSGDSGSAAPRPAES